MKAKSVKTRPINETTVSIPGSKSISHRVAICAALARGDSTITNLLDSEDLRHTVSALETMGAGITHNPDGTLGVTGMNGKPGQCSKPIYLGNSGTSMRLLAGVAALGSSDCELTGDERMQQRPMGDLLNALAQAGVEAVSRQGSGTPPVIINGKSATGGAVCLDCSRSSQYLSALLMAGPCFKQGLSVSLISPPVSSPYIDITMAVMKLFHVSVVRTNDLEYHVPGGQSYLAGEVAVEPDISNASYFWAAGALSGEMVRVANVAGDSCQGDLRFLDILRQMGCSVAFETNSVGVRGGPLTAVDVDMADIPDVVPTLAVVAAFARGRTTIRNIGHLRDKECDRIHAVVSQLTKMGIQADQGDDWLSVTGGRPAGAVIETFNDHRIAMAFGVAGLKVSGVVVENPRCVAKSFPRFWEIFDAL
ncbi:MAG TPA: 3-phosphoshikimate 1-carboxyvinyltransferase [Desulfobacteraceae bacterium]|nr:3-phosphoshikimate 1-carboxyvinyltransferase [Desulfobacteraceae bacterium]